MHRLRAIQGIAFDYAVIGGGTAGCLIACRLATELPQCRILVVEAGPDDSTDPDNLVPGLTKPKFGSEKGNWLYVTSPQRELNGREIVYPRGRGIGGCSANNFMAWVKGPSVDYDDWADLVDDPWWRWSNVKHVLNELEDFNPECPEGMEKYATATPEFHGQGGPIAVQFNRVWQPLVHHCLEAAQQAGHSINLDNNNGNPIGASVAQFSVKKGIRVTSANAFLGRDQRRRLGNLSIVTNTMCTRIIVKDGTAVGVELASLADGPGARADVCPIEIRVSREIVLTAGTFQSAQLLLLSGIGPRKDLEELLIPVVVDLPGVGCRIRDHTALSCEYVIKPSILGHNQVLNSQALLSAAREEYTSTHTGPLSVFGASAALIFPRLPGVLSSNEIENAGSKIKSFLSKPNRPSTEIWMHSGPLFYTGPCPADASVLVMEALNQNCLSEGALRLRSRNPREPPIVDPNYMVHPLDRRVALETLQEILRLAKTEALTKIVQRPLLEPKSDREEDLDSFIRENLTQGFHSMGSCVMGHSGNSERVVDNRFRVDNIGGLRVADMSVCPILTTNHTQVNAYLIGVRCAEVLLEEVVSATIPAKI